MERTKENFLRKRNIMPVNVYNGSPSRTNKPFSIGNDLFLSTAIWDKQTAFNKFSFDDKSDLNYFLNLLACRQHNLELLPKSLL